jgi:hypothetical protein
MTVYTERSTRPEPAKEANVMDKKHLIESIIEALHNCDDLLLLDLIYKLLLQ